MKYKVLDLFCGCGGLSKGLIDTGAFEVIAGIDHWSEAINTYNINFQKNKKEEQDGSSSCHMGLCKDLSTYCPADFAKDRLDNSCTIDVIVGGPPCCGFSIAGRRNTKDPRNSLFQHFCEYIDYFRPRMFMMENVVGILSMKTEKNEKVIDIIMDRLSKNYTCVIHKVCASDFEVPQNRNRVIIMGVLFENGKESDFDFVHDLIKTSVKPYLRKEDRVPISRILVPREQVPDKYYLSEKALAGIRCKKEKMKSKKYGFGAQFLDFDKPSYTIPARYYKDGYDALIDYGSKGDVDTMMCGEVRRLTIEELKRIQSFPDDFEFQGNNKNIIMQIGNAVPCKLAFHLGLALKSVLDSDVVHTT